MPGTAEKIHLLLAKYCCDAKTNQTVDVESQEVEEVEKVLVCGTEVNVSECKVWPFAVSQCSCSSQIAARASFGPASGGFFS